MKRNLFILCLVIILCGVVLNSGCDIFNIYKIKGTWEISKTTNEVTIKMMLIFRGSKDRGDIIDGDYVVGSYWMHYEDDIEFEILFLVDDFLVKEVFSGGFDSKDVMSGTFDVFSYATNETTEGGTWFAVRLAEEL